MAGLFFAFWAGITSDREFSIRFYESAAQVIPVLLLVLAIELRVFDPSAAPARLRFRPAPSRQEIQKRLETPALIETQIWFSRFVVLGAMVIGEVTAFRVIAYSEPGLLAQAIVLGSIVGALIMIVLVAVRRDG